MNYKNITNYFELSRMKENHKKEKDQILINSAFRRRMKFFKQKTGDNHPNE